MRWRDGREVALSGHALAETYSVLTRMPGGRLSPTDVARAIDERLGAPLLLDAQAMRGLPQRLAGLGIVGGATYDALVALAAVEHDADLATRDARARPTYEAVGARVVIVG